jgi:hypothetical protein
MANTLVLDRTTRTKGIGIEVQGTMANGALTVRSIKESAGMM